MLSAPLDSALGLVYGTLLCTTLLGLAWGRRLRVGAGMLTAGSRCDARLPADRPRRLRRLAARAGVARELRQTLETMARMTGELRDQAQLVVLADSSAFKAVAAAERAVLEPHLKLRGRVAEALRAATRAAEGSVAGRRAAASATWSK